MVKEIKSRQEFNKECEFSGLLVIDYFAPWCGPCRKISPFIDSLVTKYSNVHFIKVDIDLHSDIAEEKNISSIPTFQFMVNGHLVAEVSGADSSAIEKQVIEHQHSKRDAAPVAAPSTAPPAEKELNLKEETIGMFKLMADNLPEIPAFPTFPEAKPTISMEHHNNLIKTFQNEMSQDRQSPPVEKAEDPDRVQLNPFDFL